MPADQHDKRKSTRHYFAPEEEVVGIFFIKELDKQVPFKIANISNGGLYFSCKRGSNIDLLKNCHLFLEEIKGKSDLCFSGNIELLIRWVLDEDILQHVGFGCQFVNLPEPLFKQINEFIAFESVPNKG